MKTVQMMTAAMALASANAFAPASTSSTTNTALQAGFASEFVQIATVAGAGAVIFFADKSGPKISAATPAPAAAAPAASSSDISVPYDAAAMLAYDAAGKPGGDFASFKAKYVQETVAMIKSKQKNLVSA